MEPFKATELPIEYTINKELLSLVADANQRYGEYKAALDTLELDTKYFLDSVLLTESYKSTQIEGTQISQDEMYYLKYMKASDDSREIQNLKTAISYAEENILEGLNYHLVNDMHRILLDSVRGSEKMPGEIRKTQNWIGPRGCGIENASFVPPVPEEVYSLLMNLYAYMNDPFIDPTLVNIAVSHAQFETIHAYKDGNGRLGRAIIPVQMSYLDESKPILFMSEILELYKPSYQRHLMEYRRGNISGFICFFLQCVIDQCKSYIYRIDKVRGIYKEDAKAIESIRGNSIYKLMPIIKNQIVFTKKELQDASGVSVNVVSNLVNQLVERGILVQDTTVMKKGYKYKRIYDVFVN